MRGFKRRLSRACRRRSARISSQMQAIVCMSSPSSPQASHIETIECNVQFKIEMRGKSFVYIVYPIALGGSCVYVVDIMCI